MALFLDIPPVLLCPVSMASSERGKEWRRPEASREEYRRLRKDDTRQADSRHYTDETKLEWLPGQALLVAAVFQHIRARLSTPHEHGKL